MRRGNLLKFIQTIILVYVILVTSAYAGEADVISVETKKSGDNKYLFTVTVFHDDEDLNYYADKWDVVAPTGAILDTRVLTLSHSHAASS
jgi:hypothetical protein